jgi:hypothetical protein
LAAGCCGQIKNSFVAFTNDYAIITKNLPLAAVLTAELLVYKLPLLTI